MVLRELLAKFSIDFDSSKLKAGGKSISSFIGGLKELWGVVAGAAAGYAAVSFISHIAAIGDELTKASQQLGLSATELLEWRHVANLSGASAEVLGVGMATLTRNASAAADGNADMAKSFADLGVSLTNADGSLRPVSELFNDSAVAVGGLDNEAQKVALSMKLFGESGRKLLPAFNAGADGIAAMRAEVRELFGSDLEQFVEMSAASEDATARFDLALLAVKTTIALEVLPVFTRIVSSVTRIVAGFRTMSQGNHLVQIGLLALAAAAAVAAIALLAPFAEVIAIAALVVGWIVLIGLVIDDLYSLFTGGRSFIGAFIDSLFGVGAAATFVHTVKDAWEDLTTAVGAAWEGTKAFVSGAWEAISSFARSVQGVFGTVRDFLVELWSPPLTAAQGFFGALFALGSSIASSLGNVFGVMGSVITSAFTFAFDNIRRGAELVADALGIDIASVGGFARRLGGTASFVAGQAQADAGSAALGLARGSSNALTGALSGATNVVRGATPAAQTIQQATNVAAININGAGDPAATARAVRDELQATTARSLIAAQDALVQQVD